MDLKKLQLSYGMERVFEEMPHLKHKSDGIIFTSSVSPYGIGTCEKMIKWKPSEENTVDFKVDVRGPTEDPQFMLQLWHGSQKHEDFCEMTLEDDVLAEWKLNPPKSRVIECRYDPNWPNRWRFARFRDDKTQANHISVYHSIMKSIEDNVDEATVR
ncbi:Dcp1p-Dcp2p decapping enzyme complex alpha subunit, partial [Dinochytrium kinnereticum]